MMKVRFADLTDLETVRHIDPHSMYIDSDKIKCKIVQHEILLAEVDETVIGIIKFSYLWGTRPFLDLIYLLPEWRGKKLSRPFLQFLEDYLQKSHYCYLFSSAEKVDDFAGEWHLSNSFVQCGEVNNLNAPHDVSAEVFFYKRIAIGDESEDRLNEYPV